jgi:hypothetical protein
MALVLLKRNVVALWEQVGAPGQEEVKEKLLALLSIQLPSRVLSILTNTVAAVALAISDKGGEKTNSIKKPVKIIFGVVLVRPTYIVFFCDSCPICSTSSQGTGTSCSPQYSLPSRHRTMEPSLQVREKER